MEENLERCIKFLEDNEKNAREEARKVLLNICNNVLKSPNNDKFREVRLDDEIVIEKLLPVTGAMECLFEVGYEEDGERIFLPHSTSLLKLQHLSKLLSPVPENYYPITVNIDNNSKAQEIFFKKITQHFHDVMLYEDPELQKKAKEIIPLVQLEIATMLKIRDIQKFLKLHNAAEATTSQFKPELIAQELFLVELLKWFKYEFFKWFDKPTCSICSIECVYKNTIQSTDPFCSRIELYRCENCNKVVEFPRYCHPEPLLTLRRGRCGEWANVFTLLCRSLGYDSRLVCDETDHIWTEIWLISNKKWIHLDPCENAIDKPLMYEKGWKKKLTYIIAFSKDEVQDVTWRYTQDQNATLKRRKICNELSLIQFLQSLNNERQNSPSYSKTRKEYVTKRALLELVEMLDLPNSERQYSNDIYEGRSSGSLAWRLARGEFAQVDVEKNNYIWNLSKYGQTFELQYNVVKDIYHVVQDGNILEYKSGWNEGMNTIKGRIIRKVEHDWKMVYLARSPQEKYGHVRWTFQIVNSKLYLDTFSLKATSEIFHGGSVSWKIEAIFNDDKIIIIPINNCNSFHTNEVQGAVKLNVVSTLSGGQGQLAWQHAQLFRQSLKDTDKPSMTINIRLKN